MRYSFDGGEPQGIYQTTLTIMATAKRDGHDWVWEDPDGLQTVRPTPLGLGIFAARHLRQNKQGSTSVLITRHEAVQHDLRYPVVKV